MFGQDVHLEPKEERRQALKASLGLEGLASWQDRKPLLGGVMPVDKSLEDCPFPHQSAPWSQEQVKAMIENAPQGTEDEIHAQVKATY